MSVDLLFKKYFFGIVLGLVALAAYFQASGVSHLVGEQLAPGSGPTLPPMAQAKFSRIEKPSAKAIHDRNPFDSEKGPLNPPPVAEKKEEKISFDDPLTVPACSGVTVFILSESDDPLWSFASIQGDGDSGPKLRRVGDTVGSRKVAFIGFNPMNASPTVWLEGSDLCQSSLFGDEAVAPPKPPEEKPDEEKAAAPKPANKGAAKMDPEIGSKIKKISDTEIEIDRSAVDKILADQAQLMRSARIVPEQKDGKTVGIRLFGVRPDTLLGALGLKNGDRLEQINGFDMGSPEKALEAYARLRTADSLKLTLNRRGQPTTIDIKIK